MIIRLHIHVGSCTPQTSLSIPGAALEPRVEISHTNQQSLASGVDRARNPFTMHQYQGPPYINCTNESNYIRIRPGWVVRSRPCTTLELMCRGEPPVRLQYKWPKVFNHQQFRASLFLTSFPIYHHHHVLLVLRDEPY
jgi:hypothetical protein